MNRSRRMENGASDRNSEQRDLMHRVQSLSFALVETNLYLDGHPNSKIAMEYFDSIKAEYNAAVAEYEEKFGPLTAGGGQSNSVWRWVRTPWPWETGYPESGETAEPMSPDTDD